VFAALRPSHEDIESSPASRVAVSYSVSVIREDEISGKRAFSGS
jgi:hypothetical protein